VEKKVKVTNNSQSEVWIYHEVYGKAPEKYHFVLKDGKKLKDLKELTESLNNMSEEVFRHHVNDIRNDFSKWINDVFKEKDLANDIKRFHSKIETQLALYKHFEKKLLKLAKK